MAEAASLVVASSKPTSVPSWARHSHDCLSRWNSRSGKMFQFFFVANGKWARKKQLQKQNFVSYGIYDIIGNFPSADVFRKQVQTDKLPIV